MYCGYSRHHGRGAATKAGTTGSFSKPYTILWFTIHLAGSSGEIGHWNSVWKRFWRLSRSGTFEAFFDALAAMSETAHLVQMFDSTVVRAHVSAAGAKGGSMIRHLAARVAIPTKVHLKTDFGGLPIAFHLTGGEASDSCNFETLLDIGPD